MKAAFARCVGGMGLVVMVGCAGTGEVIPLQLHAVPPIPENVAKSAEPLRVAIGEFEDVRSYRTGLGVRTHLWGGVSYFDVPGGKPGDAVAQALTEYLTAKGWHVIKPGSSERADVGLVGKILELFVHAKSRVGFTQMTTQTKLAIRANNSSDGSLVRMTLNGAGSEDVFWFEPEDLEAVVNDVLTDSFNKLVHDTKVEHTSLRLTGP
ncbi:MAG TPA: YajG family lipoprotein [Spirochaetia bacterium]|nr:YajG family lipoprotein [Spirochaetia bacterium]